MSKSTKLCAIIAAIIFAVFLFSSQNNQKQNDIPLIAIANYGPHASLQQTIEGIKSELFELGYRENENIRYEIADVNFETSLIIQMLTKLKSSKPKLIVAISTPIAQAAKNMIRNIPVVYADVTDPLDAGLVNNHKYNNITGASDRQDLSLMLQFAKQLLPSAKTVGLLYSTGEANDLSLLGMLQKDAKQQGLKVIAVPIEHTRDIVIRMQLFKDKVDFIYTGSSGAIQAALPAIISTAESMKLPLFNFNSDEVIAHNALASYGVSHAKIGANAARIIDQIMQGKKPENIKPIYPTKDDHAAYISRKRANNIGIIIPDNLPKHITIVD